MQFGLDFVRKCGFRERSVRSHLVARCYLVPCMWWCQTWEQFSLIPLRTTGWHGRRGVVLPDSRGMCCMNVGRCGGRSVDTPAGGPHQPQLRATCLASECVWPDNGRAGYKGHLPGTRLRGLTGLPSIPPPQTPCEHQRLSPVRAMRRSGWQNPIRSLCSFLHCYTATT